MAIPKVIPTFRFKADCFHLLGRDSNGGWPAPSPGVSQGASSGAQLQHGGGDRPSEVGSIGQHEPWLPKCCLGLSVLPVARHEFMSWVLFLGTCHQTERNCSAYGLLSQRLNVYVQKAMLVQMQCALPHRHLQVFTFTMKECRQCAATSSVFPHASFAYDNDQ